MRDAGVEPPEAGAGDAAVPDASVACSLPAPQDPGSPWASRCETTLPADTCASLVLPAAGPVPPASLGEWESCDGPGECAEGLLCDKGDAGPGASGVCITAGPGECRYDVECPWAERCLDGQCTEGKAMGAACDNPRACGKYLICARGEDGGTCAPEPRLGERCLFTSPDGGFPSWTYSCLTGRCNAQTSLCE